MEPTTVLCDVVFHFAGSTARVTFPLARADAYILRTLADPREMLAEELARYRVALDCVIEISVHRKNAPDWRWTAPGAHAPEQGEPRDLTLIPPAPEAPGREARTAPRAPRTAWGASWVLPCELDVPKLTYHMHRHVRHGYQVITLHTFEATGMGSLYHCGRFARTGRVAELVEYADTIADRETPCRLNA